MSIEICLATETIPFEIRQKYDTLNSELMAKITKLHEALNNASNKLINKTMEVFIKHHCEKAINEITRNDREKFIKKQCESAIDYIYNSENGIYKINRIIAKDIIRYMHIQLKHKTNDIYKGRYNAYDYTDLVCKILPIMINECDRLAISNDFTMDQYFQKIILEYRRMMNSIYAKIVIHINNLEQIINNNDLYESIILHGTEIFWQINNMWDENVSKWFDYIKEFTPNKSIATKIDYVTEDINLSEFKKYGLVYMDIIDKTYDEKENKKAFAYYQLCRILIKYENDLIHNLNNNIDNNDIIRFISDTYRLSFDEKIRKINAASDIIQLT